jgi:hypothetical protein
MPPKCLSIDCGRLNLALCLIEPDPSDATGASDVVRQWAVVAVGGTTARDLFEALEALGVRDWLDPAVDSVVIERQPLKNPKMKMTEHYLEMYFAVAGVPADTQDAKHKLSYAASTAWWPAGGAPNWTYHFRKKLAVQTTQALLDAVPGIAGPELRATWGNTKKRDDLADCLLQGLARCHFLAARPRTAAVAPGEAGKPAKVVVARRPTAKTKAYTRGHVKWLVVRALKGSAATGDNIQAAVSGDKRLCAALVKHFVSAAECARLCFRL